jgi:hypothetical protein
MLILFQWIFAHLLADFGLQTKKMIQHKIKLKARSWILYGHCLLHGALIYLFSPDKTIWLIPVTVSITHFFIDLWKLHRRDNAFAFIADQFMHMLVLTILWLMYYQSTGWWQTQLAALGSNINIWIIISGYMFIIFPLAYVLGYATAKWRNEVETFITGSPVSLSEAGRWIGIFERILVYTFVITNHFEGIGFLIAAKSILRFSDIKSNTIRKEAEYVLIGTLMSFASSILIGLAVRTLLLNYHL